MRYKYFILFFLTINSSICFSQLIPFNANINLSKYNICPGENVTATANISAGPAGFIIGAPHTFNWYKGTYNFSSGEWSYSLLSSGASNTIVLNEVSDYKLVVNSTGSGIPAVETSFSVSAAFYPEIYTQFDLTSVCSNQTLKIDAYPKSNPDINQVYTYQWILNNIDIPNATNHQFLASGSGTYKVRISNGTCSFTSNSKTITSSNSTINETPVIRATNNNKICYGTNTYLINSVNQNPNYTFRWARLINSNGNIIENLGTTYIENYFQPADSGSYKGYIFNQDGCYVSSNVIQITKPAINPGLTTLYGGFCDSASVINTISNPQNYNFQWAAMGEVQTSPTISNFTFRKDTVLFDNKSSNILGLKNFQILPSAITDRYLTNWTLESYISGSDGCAVLGSRNYYNKQITGNAFSVLPTSPNPGILRNVTTTSAVYCLGSPVLLGANIKFTVGELLDPPSGAVAYYKWTGPNNFTSTLRQPYFQSIAENNAGEYTLTVDYYGAGNPVLCTSRTFKTIILIKPLDFYILGESPLDDPKVYCDGSNFNVNLSWYHDNFQRENGDYGLFTGVWTDPNGNVKANISNSSTASFSITNFNSSQEGEYVFTGNLVGGVCPTSNIILKKKLVIATAENIKLTQTITPDACVSAGFQLFSNVGNGNITAGTAMKKYSFTGPGANWINQEYFHNVAVNYTTSNLGTYQHSLHACGITKSLPSNLVYPINCPPLTSSIFKNEIVETKSIQSSSASITLPTIVNIVPGSAINILPIIIPFYAENTFLWNGPNGFTSTSKRLFIPNSNNSHEGEYTLTSYLGSGFSPSTIVSKIIIGVDNKPTNFEISPKVLSNGPINKCITQRLDFQDNIKIEPADAFGSASFLWTGPSGFTSTNPYPVISQLQAQQAGDYKVIVTFSGKYSGVDSAIINVSLDPKAIIEGSDLICSGSSISLSGKIQDLDRTPGQALTYSWSGPNGFSSTIKNPIISSAGTFSLNITKTGGGCNGTYSTQKIVVLNPNPYTTKDLEVENYYLSNPLIKNKETGNYLPDKSFVLNATYPGIINSLVWTGPNGFNKNTSQAIVLSPTYQNQGIYTISANVKATACNGGTMDVNISKTVNINILGCPNNLLLENISGNIISSEKIQSAENSIQAANQIISGKVIYRANKYILLEPGFRADNGVVFKTEFGGCN